jgi:ribosome-binding factor A
MAEDIARELSVIMRGLKDPRITPMTGIVKVDLSGDLSHCKIYVSCIEGMDAAKKSAEGLQSAAGFIKRELFSKLDVRKCPDLKFIADDSIAQSAEISKMIDEVNG